MHMRYDRIHTEIVIFVVLAMDVNCFLLPLLQLLFSPNAHLNDGVFKFVFSFAQRHVLVNTIVNFRYSTKVSKIRG